MYRLKFYLCTHSFCLLGLMLLWQFVLNICADILRVCAWAHTKKYNDWVIWWLYVIYSERLLQFFHKMTALFHIVTNIFGHVSSSKFSPVLAMVNLFFITTILMDLKLYLLMILIFAFLQCQITVNIFLCAYWLCLWLLSENTYYNSSYIFLIIFLSIIKLCMLFLC